MNIQIKKKWKTNEEVLVLMINRSPGFAMKKVSQKKLEPVGTS